MIEEHEQVATGESLLPPAREHSYLPGSITPLYAENQRRRSSRHTSSHAVSEYPQGFLELAVLDLRDVVLFPGDSIPVRLHGEWVRFLGAQIESARRFPGNKENQEIRFGILTKVDETAEALLAVDRRRQSWTRRGVGPRRLSRISQRLIQELGDLDELSADENHNNNNHIQRLQESSEDDDDSMGEEDEEEEGERTNGVHPTRRRGRRSRSARRRRRRRRRENHDADGDSSEEGRLSYSDVRTVWDASLGGSSSSLSSIEHASAEEEVLPVIYNRLGDGPSVGDEDQSQESETSAGDPPSVENPVLGEVREVPIRPASRGGVATIRLRNDNNRASAGSMPRFRPLDWNAVYTSPRSKIGTIVTVMFTHDTNNNSTDGNSRRLFEGEELVVTALGTGRFRIISPINEIESGPYNPHYNPYQVVTVKKFLCEELEEEPLTRPCLSAKQHGQTIHFISSVTPVPLHVYEKTWPWTLVRVIRETLDRVSSFAGVVQSLPSLAGTSSGHEDYSILEPLRFSYWLASNLPLRIEEKLEVLQLYSTIERLRYLLEKVKLVEASEASIQCRNCGIPLTRTKHVFTVGGAEGTTGNYVNEYGHVHQTLTVKEIDEDEVRFQGRPETRDSWFPGYSWLIMNCGFCLNHIGWKFQRVGQEEGHDGSINRPAVFYGLSAASIKTFVHERRSHRSSRMAEF